LVSTYVYETIGLLIKYGAETNIQTEDGSTYLEKIIKINDFDLIRIFFNSNSNVNFVNHLGESALWKIFDTNVNFLNENNLNMLKLFITEYYINVDISRTIDNRTILHHLFDNKNKSCTYSKLLYEFAKVIIVDGKADVNCCDICNNTILHYVVQYCALFENEQRHLMKQFDLKSNEKRKRGRILLIDDNEALEIMDSLKDVVKLLIEYGCDVQLQNDMGFNAWTLYKTCVIIPETANTFQKTFSNGTVYIGLENILS